MTGNNNYFPFIAEQCASIATASLLFHNRLQADLRCSAQKNVICILSHKENSYNTWVCLLAPAVNEYFHSDQQIKYQRSNMI